MLPIIDHVSELERLVVWKGLHSELFGALDGGKEQNRRAGIILPEVLKMHVYNLK